MKQIPEFLYSTLIEDYGEETTNRIIKGYTLKRPLTLRINIVKTNVDHIKDVFKSKNIDFEELSWYEHALIIKNTNKETIEKLDIYKNGEIYFQSLSSMLPPLMLSIEENESILDMTAAPGSKTTQLSCLYNNTRITAVEKDKVRFERLKYNIEKQGATNVSVINMDALKLDDLLSFDKILLDAPCSGSGTLNINNIDYFSEKLVNNLSDLQEKLLEKALMLLKPGSEMIYSTCSILKKENESVLNKIMAKFDISIVNLESKFIGIDLLPTNIKGTICILPNELYEGFFIAKIRKNK